MLHSSEPERKRERVRRRSIVRAAGIAAIVTLVATMFLIQRNAFDNEKNEAAFSPGTPTSGTAPTGPRRSGAVPAIPTGATPSDVNSDARPRSLIVRLVDDRGSPVGARVVSLGGSPGAGGEAPRFFASGATDNRGLVTLAIPESAESKKVVNGVWLIAVERPGKADLIRHQALPKDSEILTIDLGSLGAVDVDAAAEFARLGGAKLTAFLNRRREDGIFVGFASCVVVDGAARFDGVELDLDLEVALADAGRRYQPGRVRVQGPRAAGERIAVTVGLGPGRLQVSGRLLDPSSAPVADASFEARFTSGGPLNEHRATLQAGPDGRFNVFLAASTKEIAESTLEVIVPSSEARPAGGRRLKTMSAVVSADAGGPIDAGDFVIEPWPVALAGTVVLSTGEPVVGAFVRVSPRDAVGSWPYTGMPAAISSTTGAFEIFGDAPGSLLQVDFGKSDFAPVPMGPVVAGSKGLRLVLEPAFKLVGSVLLDSPTIAGLVSVELRCDDGPLKSAALTPVDGEFALHSLRPPLSGRLFVMAQGRVLGESPPIRVPTLPPGRVVMVPPIEVRARVRVQLLDLIDDRGQPVDAAFLAIRRVGGDEDGVVASIRVTGGKASLLLLEGEDEFEVMDESGAARRYAYRPEVIRIAR